MKKWFKLYLLLSVIVLGFISILNYMIDPLWTFNNSNSLQIFRDGFNERQQKVNLIQFSSVSFDSIIIGSSRITIHNQKDIGGSVFNLAADGMQPSEFNNYIDFLKKTKKQKIKVIYIGLDFLPVANNFSDSNITHYINISNQFAYRYKNLINYDSTKHSINALRNKFFQRYKNKFKTYDENYIAKTHTQSGLKIKNLVEKKASIMNNKVLKYNREAYIMDLKILKDNNPNTKFVIFTTPMPTPIYEAIFINQANIIIYKQWIADIIDIFGEVNNFVYRSKISDNYKVNFVDEGHYSSDVAKCIDSFLIGIKLNDCKNFGMKLTAKNTIELDNIIKEMDGL